MQTGHFELDQANAQAVDSVGLGNQAVVQRVDHPVVKRPVHRVRVLQQAVVYRLAARASHDAQMRLLDHQQFGITHTARKTAGCFALQHVAQLERVVDHGQIDMRYLQAALRHGFEQPFGFQARDELPHRAQRHAQQLHQLALRYELAWPNVRRNDLLLEVRVGARPQRGGRRVGGDVHASVLRASRGEGGGGTDNGIGQITRAVRG